MTLHTIVENAAEGRLPDWAVVSDERRAHMGRVAGLLDEWALASGMSDRDRLRWKAAGHLHDALREADAEALRPRVPPDLQGLPGPVLHGPAAAERLRVDGVADGSLLRAIAFHTIGCPRFDSLGRALFAADFLEPGRAYRREWRAELRARMPGDFDGVVRDVVGARIAHGLERRRPVATRTLELWNRLVESAG